MSARAMTPERWRRVKVVLAEALDAAPDERAAIVDRACGEDPVLRDEVESLLAAAADPGSFLETNAAANRTRMPTGEDREHDPALRAALEAGLAGRYSIERELGRGGTATVYLAEDRRNGRRVAMKVLDPALGALLGSQRFLAEVRVMANLAHPNILPLFDSGEVGGLLYYTMPCVTGETLRERLRRERQLPIDEALRLTTVIAGALDYAHRQGIVHRDLKPENILLEEGQPLVADFGIALAMANAGGSRLTETGLSLGTPQYMSPEQAAGDRAIDVRSDVYALGVMAYEMLAGEPPHTGANAQAILARVLTEVPRPLRAARAKVPAHVEAAVAKALEKLPADRFESAARFGESIAGRVPMDVPSTDVLLPGDPGRAEAPPSAWHRVPWRAALAGGGILIGAAVLAIPRWQRHEATAPTIRFSFPVTSVKCLAVSPDGMRIAYSDGPRAQLYVRDLREGTTRALAGAEGLGPSSCFFSPDGEWIGYLADGRLQKINIESGALIPIVSLRGFSGASWGSKDIIIYSDPDSGGLSEVPAAGGAPRPFTRPDSARGEVGQQWPSFLPDGERVVLTSVEGRDQTDVGIASREGRVTLLRVAGEAQPVAGDRLLIRTGRTLYAAQLDMARPALAAPPVEVLQRAFRFAVGGPAVTLVYSNPQEDSLVLVLLGPDGKQEQLTSVPRILRHPRLSPDGKHVVVEAAGDAGVHGGTHIETYDIARQIWTRLMVDGACTDPIWSQDGRRIAFTIWGPTGFRPVWSPADGSRAPEPLFKSATSDFPTTFTPDGQAVVMDEMPGRDDPVRIAVASVGGGSPKVILGSSDITYRYAALSPDGHWLAYTSTETSRREVFVRRFPVSDGGYVQISQAGGKAPVWSRDGRELYYRDGTNIMLAELRTRPSFEVISRRAIATDDFYDDNGVNYDATPDGKLVLLRPAKGATTQQVNVIVNWLPELQRLLGEKK